MLIGLIRIFIRSFRRRGILGTIRLCIRLLFDLQTYNLPRGDKDDLADEFDLNYGVDTKGSLLQPTHLVRTSDNWIYAKRYQPTPPQLFKEMLAYLPTCVEDFVFVDFGSGKGRILLLAAELPFKKVIGIEFSEQLNQIARNNMRATKNKTVRCSQVTSICMDAVDYEIPIEPTVCFFFNPFEELVMKRVVEQIERSLRILPRAIYILYYNPECNRLFQESKCFAEIKSTKDYRIYKSVVANSQEETSFAAKCRPRDPAGV